MKDSFILYTNINEMVKALTVEESGLLFRAILDYEETGQEPEVEGAVKVAFISIRQDLDANADKYEQVKQSRSDAGKKGAKTRWEQLEENVNDSKNGKATFANSKNNKAKNEMAKMADNVYVYDNDNVINNTIAEIVTTFNAVCISLPKVTRVTDKRKKKIQARLKAFTVEEILGAFVLTEQSEFLSGRSGNWRASFDWLIENDNNLTKVLEGTYSSGKKVKREDRLKQAYEDLQREIEHGRVDDSGKQDIRDG